MTFGIATNTSYPYFDETLFRSIQPGKIGDWPGKPFSDVFTYDVLKSIRDQFSGDHVDEIIDDTLRGGLALLSCQVAAQYQIPYSLCDYNSSIGFKALLEGCKSSNVGIFSIDQKGETVASARQEATNHLLSHASVQRVGWTEPEKFLAVPLLQRIALSTPEEVQLAVPGRKDSLFKAFYPLDQFASETLTNGLITGSLRRFNLWKHSQNLDLMGGMRIFNVNSPVYGLFMEEDVPDYIPSEKAFSKYRHRYTHLMLPPIQAIKEGFRVETPEIIYLHPFIQSSREFYGNRETKYFSKRVEQMCAILYETYTEIYGSKYPFEIIDELVGEYEGRFSGAFSERRRIGRPEFG